jgi:hypothetical protein
MAVGRQYFHRLRQPVEPHPFDLCMVVLEGECGHFFLRPAVEKVDFLRAQTTCRVRRVDGRVAAANHGADPAHREIRLGLVALDESKRVHDTPRVLSRNAQHVHGTETHP